MIGRIAAFVVALAAGCGGALANDTMAQLGTGGLIHVRSDAVAMETEDLFISPDAVRITYGFRNTSEQPVESVVAFPMPDISGNPYANVSIPDYASDNFLDFSVTVDGQSIKPELDQRVIAAGVDVTAALVAARIPLFPFLEGIDEPIGKLPQATRDDWVSRGILFVDEFDDGSGMKKVWTPYWTLKSTYWWRMTFPAKKLITVKHDYKPSVGGTVGTTFLEDGKARGERFDEYKAKYCMDPSFVKPIEAAAMRNPDKQAPFVENWISYVLMTGGNWATSIGKFKLTIDKGSAKNMISFCGKGVKKVGPTTFEMTAEDFYPEKNLEILLMLPMTQDGGN